MEASYCYMLDEAKKRQQQQQQNDESSEELDETEDVTEQFEASSSVNQTEMEEESSAIDETVGEEDQTGMTHEEEESDEDTINEDEESDSSSSGQQTPTIERNALSLENDEHNLDSTTNINDLNLLKKNLANEEEFRSINQSEPIHIFLKLKPLTDKESTAQNNQKFYKLHSDTTISLLPPKNCVYAQNKQSMQNLTNTLFQFSYIFQPDIKQQDFFMATIYPCMEKFFNGDNLLIFSYGVTNSGKTYTMQGPSNNPGLIPRTLDLLFDSLKSNLETKKAIYQFKPEKFNEICSLSDAELSQELNYKEQILRLSNYKETPTPIERHDSCDTLATTSDTESIRNLESSKKFGSLDSLLVTNTPGFDSCIESNKIKVAPNKKYALWICFYELYNDMVYDLLTLPRKANNGERPALKIREDINRVPYVEGLVHIPVFNTNEAIKVLKYGEKNLQKSSNSINQSSSRSHAIFCLKLVCIENSTIKNGSSIVQINQLSFCDLAGIERTSKTQAVGKTQKEASTINTSLLSLSRCIETMMQNQKNKNNQMQVPYRVNKLTRLFQAYFEGRGMVKMIVNLNPAVAFFNENVNVLKFASIANKIQIGLNDDDKIQYKIDAEEAPVNNRLTVAWEVDKSRMTETEEEEEEGTDDESEEEDEETMAQDDDDEETEEEESEDEETESEEEETGSEEEVTESEEEETETETTMEQSCNDTTAQVNVKFKIPPISAKKNQSTTYPKTPVPVKKTVNKTDIDMTRESQYTEESDEDLETEEEETDEEESEEELGDESVASEQTTDVTESMVQDSICDTPGNLTTTKTPQTGKANKTSKSILKSALKSEKKPSKHLSINEDSVVAKKRKTNEKLDINSPNPKRASLDSGNVMSKLSSAPADKSTFEAMTKEALVDYMVKYMQNAKREMFKFESELRKEIVDRWSKRVDDTEEYFQNEMEKQRAESEASFQQRLNLAEMCIQRNSQLKLAEAKKENEAVLEKLRLECEKASKERDELYQKLTALESMNEFTSAKSHMEIERPEMSDESLQTDTPCTISTGVDADSKWLNDIEQSFNTKLEQSQAIYEEALSKLNSQEAEYNQLRADYNKLCDVKKQAEAELSQKLNEQIAQTKYFQQKEIEAKTQYTEALGKSRHLAEQVQEQIEHMAKIQQDLDQVKKNEDAIKYKLEATIKELQKQLDETEEKVNRANKELEEALSRVKKYEEKIQQLNQELDSSTKLSEMLNNSFAKVETQKAQMSERILELEASLNEATTQLTGKCDEIKQQLEAQFANEREQKKTEIEMLKNEVFFKQNQIEKLETELEDRKKLDAFREAVNTNNSRSKLTKTTEIEPQPHLTTSTSSSSLAENPLISTNQTSKASKKEKIVRDDRNLIMDEEMLVEEEAVVIGKPPSRSTSTRQPKSSVTPTTSSASLRKATRSTSKLHGDVEPQTSIPPVAASTSMASVTNTSTSLAHIEEEAKPVAKVTRKASRATSSSKLKKTKQVEDEAEMVVEEPVVTKKNKKESIVDTVTPSIPVERELIDDSDIEEVPEGPKKASNIKKKSTLSRLADIITKSPILEPLRNRPTRKTALKQSNLSEPVSAAASKGGSLDRKLKSILKEKPVESLEKIQDEEENVENVEPEEKVRKTTRKRRAAV